MSTTHLKDGILRPLSATAPVSDLPLRLATTLPLKKVVDTYASALRALVPEQLGKGWCVSATRVAQLVFREFGISVAPLVVCTTLINTAALELLGIVNRRTHRPWDQPPMVLALGQDPPDDRALRGGSWYGHLVPVVDGRYIVDAALRQSHQPWLGIHTPDVLIEDVGESLLRGLDVRLVHRVDRSVTRIVYSPRPADPNLERLPFWEAEPNGWNCTRARELLTKMRSDLGLS